MKPSPLTFLDLKFLRVHVEADFNYKEETDKEFSFHGTQIGWAIKHGKNEDGTYWIAVAFATSNEDAEVLCPYLIDIQAVGRFDIDEEFDSENKERVVYENGAALVYGSIRDMVSTITSRGQHGGIMLPTPTFIGTYQEHLDTLQTEGAEEKADSV